MSSPTPPPRQFTYQDALAAAAALQAARSSKDTVSSAASLLSDSTINVRETVSRWALNLILQLWRSVNPYDGKAVQQFTVDAAARMVTAQSTVARAASASQQQLLSTMGVRVAAAPTNPTDVRRFDIATGGRLVQRDATVDVNYGDGGQQVVNLDQEATTQGMFNRPARIYRYQKSLGVTDQAAFDAAVARMRVLVDDNLMLAQRLAEAEMLAQAAGKDRRVIGLRRIIHPELSRTGTCGLCIAASDQVYKVTDLLAIHTNCKCTVAAVTREFDPADVLNKADLKAVYGAAGGTGSAQLKRVRFQVDEHGELGPTLVPAKPYKPRKQYQRGRRRAATPIPTQPV